MSTETQEATVAIGDKYIVGLALCTVEKIYKNGNASLSKVAGQWRIFSDPDSLSFVGRDARWLRECIAYRATAERLDERKRGILAAKAARALRDLATSITRIANGQDGDAKIAEAARLGLTPQAQDKEA